MSVPPGSAPRGQQDHRQHHEPHHRDHRCVGRPRPCPTQPQRRITARAERAAGRSILVLVLVPVVVGRSAASCPRCLWVWLVVIDTGISVPLIELLSGRSTDRMDGPRLGRIESIHQSLGIMHRATPTMTSPSGGTRLFQIPHRTSNFKLQPPPATAATAAKPKPICSRSATHY